MNRLAGISLILYAIALGAAVVSGSPRYVFACAALAVVGFLIVGYFSLPDRDAVVLFVTPPQGSIEAERTVTVDGTQWSPQAFRLRYICSLQLAKRERLLRWLLISAGAFYVLLAGNTFFEEWFQQYPIASTYCGALTGFWAIGMATSWYREQQFLMRAVVTLGTCQSAGWRFTSSSYSFRDGSGEYRGGSCLGRISDPVFVLYNPLKPDDNLPLQALKFRKMMLLKLDDAAARTIAQF